MEVQYALFSLQKNVFHVFSLNSWSNSLHNDSFGICSSWIHGDNIGKILLQTEQHIQVAPINLADRICGFLKHLNWSQSTWIYLVWLPLVWRFQNGVNQLCGSKQWRTRPTFSQKIDSKIYWNVKYFHLFDFIIYSFNFKLL